MLPVRTFNHDQVVLVYIGLTVAVPGGTGLHGLPVGGCLITA